MLRTILVNELDKPLAESRAIGFAMSEGFAHVEVLKMVRVEGAWEVHVELRV